MADDLNEPQRLAVEHGDGPLLVFAGAGSGKTRVITYRAASLIRRGVDPAKILLVTFTNRAAQEICTRVESLVGCAEAKRVWAGTFHSIGAQLLRANAAEVGRRRDFAIYDEGDQTTVVRQIVAEFGLDKKTYPAARFVARISDAKQKAWRPEDIPTDDPDAEILVRVWHRYEEWLSSCNALDFEDLILKTMRLVEAQSATGARLRAMFRHVLVDEFQDTNTTQYRLVRALASSGNLCVVGDDDQCHPPGVLVTTPGGAVPVEALLDGDIVFGWGMESNRLTPRRAQSARRTHRGSLYVLEAGGCHVPMTANHVLVTQERSVDGRGWGNTYKVAAGYVACAPGRGRSLSDYRVPLPDGEWAPIDRLDEIAYDGFVYSLNVDEDHIYVANGVVIGNCIYSWRGATVANIREFTKDFPTATVVKLEQNYRSTGNIVRVALGVVEKSSTRVPKALWTEADPGAKVRVLEAPTDREEAAVVCREIRAHLQQGVPGSELTVLYRAHVQSRPIEEALRDWQVPYRVVGGHKFYDRREVKDVLAYMRLLSNPDSDVDLLRIVNVPSRGLGPGTLKKLGEIAGSRKISLWDGLSIASYAEEIGQRERHGLRSFRDMMEHFGKTFHSERPSELAARLVSGVGYRKMWEEEEREHTQAQRHAEAQDAQQRLDNVDEFVNAVAAYEARCEERGDKATLSGYLQMVSLMTDGDRKSPNAVSLMTVHGAKGLEFRHVWLVGFEDGRFPVRGADADPLEMEEERRLAYVAITRARTTLSVSAAQQRFVHGKMEYQPPSRFVVDVPEEASWRPTWEEFEEARRGEEAAGKPF